MSALLSRRRRRPSLLPAQKEILASFWWVAERRSGPIFQLSWLLGVGRKLPDDKLRLTVSGSVLLQCLKFGGCVCGANKFG